MSGKRSVASKHSTIHTESTAGLTTSSRTLTASTSTQRKPAAAASQSITSPMTGLERQQEIRCGITRLKYSMERYRHFTKKIDGTNRTVTDVSSVNANVFFDKLAKHMPRLEYYPKKKGHPDSEPSYLNWLRGEVNTFFSEAKRVSGELAAVTPTGDGVYAGMLHGLLVEITNELANLALLLENKKLPTRVSMDLLNDQVAFHVDEFDSFFDERLHQFLSEMRNEGALYSEAVYDGTRTGDPIGMVSIVVLDVAIGLRPVRSARIALEHLHGKISLVDNRLAKSEAALKAAPAPVSQEEKLLVDKQRREFTIIRDSISQATAVFDRLRQKWKTDEADVLEKAMTGSHDLKTLLDSKKMKELQIIADIQQEHSRLVHACLPFLSPQYHRRHQETYSNPCSIRLGVRFFSAATKKFVNIFTLSPDFFPIMSRHRDFPDDDDEALSYLFPSKDQIWLPFGDFPEMVRGARCALRGTHHLLDHRRALEEQKESGGYFMMRGGERILRALLMQRCNVPINIYRERFTTQGPNFSAKAVVFRSKRPSGITAQNYFYYSTAGDIIFSFARKVVWHIPVLLLLFSLKQGVTPVTVFQLLTVGLAAASPIHNARVEAMIQHHRSKPYGDLEHFLDYLSVLGRMYRQYHQGSMTFRFLPELAAGLQCHHDAWYGLFMLRRHVLPHLNCSAATPDLPPSASASELAKWPGDHILGEMEKKFHAIILTARQLFDFYDGKCEHQGNDVPAYQEVFTVSQVLVGAWEVCANGFMKKVKYTLGDRLSARAFNAICELPNATSEVATDTYRQLRDYMELSGKRGGSDPLVALHKLLVSGNFNLDREEDFYCPQTSGWVVMAEHLNFFRFFEQLRCLHRGKTIADMRSSEVRRFPCEAYGFICMVHSPDGEDCGVLNHMSLSTIVSSSVKNGSTQSKELGKWIRRALPGLIPNTASLMDRFVDTVPVWVEGCVVGYAKVSQAEQAARALRESKSICDGNLLDLNGVVRRDFVSEMHTMEVVYVPPNSKDPAGLYIFADHGRLMRPVQKIEPSKPRAGESNHGKIISFPLVFVGTWEQTWLNIASVPSDLCDAFTQLNLKYDYMEQQGSNIISLTSATIPFFEHNCSPRNLFQCGLSKQSAGTQLQALAWRREAKLFRMYSPQKYISRTLPMDYLGLDDVSLGVNATIAVLCYTGYDLDDAVIVNHTATERGMLNAGVTIAKVVKAHLPHSSNSHESKKSPQEEKEKPVAVFHNLLSSGSRFCSELDERGFPGKRTPLSLVTFDRDHKYPPLKPNTPVYCCAGREKVKDALNQQQTYQYSGHQVTRWRHFDKGEAAWIHSIIPLEFDGPDPTSILIVFRIPRSPCIGDKFSSRHGQKGTLPLHINALDLPFTASSGITPDVIINPHAFPSRMTVGMVFEIMAAKLGAIDGRFIDNSAWSTVDEGPRVAEALGEALVRSGYNRSGREVLICGISGEQMEADVFFGISGYQRLRHMVNDKWQSRARTDPHVHRAVTKTGQPVKGRKRHGGVRVGEMERDGLLSHGIAEVVVDRLLNVSDKTIAFICTACGSLLSIYEKSVTNFGSWKSCRFCGAGSESGNDRDIQMVHIPQVLRLWVAELASIGVRVVLNVK